MASPFLVGTFVNIIPAMAALWLLLRRYEGYFEDARLFFALVVGLFAGTLTAWAEVAFGFGDVDFLRRVGPGVGLLMFVVGYALLETGVKAMVMGLKRFRGRRDAPYYGASLGLGMGAMMGSFFVARNLHVAEAAGRPYSALPLVFMILVGVGGVLAHGATGVWVAKGSSEGRLGRGWAQAMALQMPVLATQWLHSLFPGRNLALPGLVAVAYGSGLLWHASRRILDRVVPPEIRDQIRRDRRRTQRQRSP